MRLLFSILAGVVVAVQSSPAAVKVHVDFDKTFDFRQARTWTWAQPEAGRVIVARTPTDDPEAIQRQAEPLIMDAVMTEMRDRRMTHASEAADITLTYYLLLTIGSSSQTIGQFLPPVTEWGIPPFTPSTQSLKVIQQGSLVIDATAKEQVVWRGTGAGEIKPGITDEKRAALIRQTVRDILRRYPRQK